MSSNDDDGSSKSNDYYDDGSDKAQPEIEQIAEHADKLEDLEKFKQDILEHKLHVDLQFFENNPSFTNMRRIIRFEGPEMLLNFGFPQQRLEELWELLTVKEMFCDENDRLHVCEPVNPQRVLGKAQLVLPIGQFELNGTRYKYQNIPNFAVSYNDVVHSASNCKLLNEKLWYCTRDFELDDTLTDDRVPCTYENRTHCSVSIAETPFKNRIVHYSSKAVWIASFGKEYKRHCGSPEEKTLTFPANQHLLFTIPNDEILCVGTVKVEGKRSQKLHVSAKHVQLKMYHHRTDDTSTPTNVSTTGILSGQKKMNLVQRVLRWFKKTSLQSILTVGLKITVGFLFILTIFKAVRCGFKS